MTIDLSGKVAIVTGGGRGLGRAMTLALTEAGADVVAAGHIPHDIEPIRYEVSEQGRGRCHAMLADVRKPDNCERVVQAAIDRFGHLDMMVNNAGLAYPGSIVDGQPEQWREMLEVNVLALLVGSQAAVNAMRRLGNGGHVVNISSVAALRHDSGVYGATKHAVNCITQTLREELANEDIRVVNIMPGAVATNFARNYDPEIVKGIGAVAGIELDWEPGDHIPDEALEKVQSTLEKLLAAPEDIADAVLYAVSVPLRLNIDEVVVRPAQQLQL